MFSIRSPDCGFVLHLSEQEGDSILPECEQKDHWSSIRSCYVLDPLQRPFVIDSVEVMGKSWGESF